jgi:hypothetical protein
MPDFNSPRSRNLAASKLTLNLAPFLSVLLVCALLIGCKVTLIGDYDDVIDKGITDLQQTSETYFAKLLSTPATPYDQSFHDGIHARLIVLKSRATTLPKYTIIDQQLDNLTTQFTEFQNLDQISPRPISPKVVQDAESALETSIEAILKLEIALKRTGNPPPGTTTK